MEHSVINYLQLCFRLCLMNTAALSPEASYTGVPDLRRMATCESILRVKCFCQNMQQSLFHPEWSLTGSTLKSPHLWSFPFHTYITAQKLWLQRGAWMFSKHSTVKHPLLVTAYIRGISEHANNSRCQSQNTCHQHFVEIMFAMDLLRHARTVSVCIHRGVFGCEGLGGVQVEKFNHLEVLLSGGQGGVGDWQVDECITTDAVQVCSG